MLTRPYWQPLPDNEAYVRSLVPLESADPDRPRGPILDIGGSHAHRFEPPGGEPAVALGWEGEESLDLDRDPLPYGDEAAAFAYSRHTLEDLANPSHLLSEIARVAQGGYIETPSPAAELTRGVDAAPYGHRGYAHHRWILWSAGGVLNVLPKYPLVDRLLGLERTALLEQFPWAWNTYHAWTGRLEYLVWRHERDFDLSAGRTCWHGVEPGEYVDILQMALEEGERNAAEQCNRITAFQQSEVEPQEPQEVV